MLTLHVFGPNFGLPDASPFCTKALVLMRLSGLAHQVAPMSFRRAPKGKAPYLLDGGQLIADSHFIQAHLTQTHGIDFSAGYSPAQLAKGWAIARMLEEHFYFLAVYERWMVDSNFWKGPYQFFNDAPALLRPLIARVVRGKTRKTLMLQGLGRHTQAERMALALGDLDAVEAVMGDAPFLLGDRPSAADATVFAFVQMAGCRYFTSPLVDAVQSRPRLMAYVQRMAALFAPDTGP